MPLVSPIPYYNNRSSIVVSFWVLSPQGPHVGKEQGEGHWRAGHEAQNRRGMSTKSSIYHPCIANCTVYIHVWSNMVQYGPYLPQLGDLCSKWMQMMVQYVYKIYVYIYIYIIYLSISLSLSCMDDLPLHHPWLGLGEKFTRFFLVGKITLSQKIVPLNQSIDVSWLGQKKWTPSFRSKAFKRRAGPPWMWMSDVVDWLAPGCAPLTHNGPCWGQAPRVS